MESVLRKHLHAGHSQSVLPLVRYRTAMGVAVACLLIDGIVKGQLRGFAVAIALSFLTRIGQLLAYMLSVQALFIAFQFTSSQGQSFDGHLLILSLGIANQWVLALLSLAVAIAFCVPLFLKRFETKQMQALAAPISARCESSACVLVSDLFVGSKLLPILSQMCRLCSAMLFLLCASTLLAAINATLLGLLLITAAGAAAALGAIIWSASHDAQAVLQARRAYVDHAQTDAGEQGKPRAIESIRVRSGAARDAYLTCATKVWAKKHASSAAQDCVLGLALAILVFATPLVPMRQPAQMSLWVLIIIAIRFVLATLRECAVLAGQLLENHAQMDALHELKFANRMSPNQGTR